jgi:hypothetical protein
MGYSGLIYAAIVAAWAGVLIPRWLRRNEEVDQARETDAARGVRVLQRRAANAVEPRRSSSVIIDGSSRATANKTAPERRGGDNTSPKIDERGSARLPTVIELDARFALAATRRRRVLTFLLGACTLSAYAAIDSLMPTYTPLVALGVLAWFLVVGRRAVIRQGRLRQVAARAAVQPPKRVVAQSDEFAEDVADDDGVRVAVLDEQDPHFVDPDAWDPVEVPLPTYMSKPAAPRVVRTIDLTQPGSWTSGRLDPASSIELPRNVPAASRNEDDLDEYDELPEHRRAVGD